MLRECRWFLDQLDWPRLVNLGGGLGAPHVATDHPLDLFAQNTPLPVMLEGVIWRF